MIDTTKMVIVAYLDRQSPTRFHICKYDPLDARSWTLCGLIPSDYYSPRRLNEINPVHGNWCERCIELIKKGDVQL